MATWVCTKCGRRTATSPKNGKDVKPGATAGGKCPAAKSGTHSYVKA